MDTLFPNTDNFFKYLLTIGLVLILFAVVYPLKKEQALRLESIELIKKNNQLRNDIAHLNILSQELEKHKIVTQKQIDTLNSLLHKGNSVSFLEIQKRKIELKDKFDERKTQLLSTTHDLDSKNIALKSEEEKHEEIKNQIWEYAVFKALFWVIGIVFCLSGFFFWMSSAYLDDFIKGGNSLNAGYQSSYVKCLNFIRKRYFVSIVIGLAFLALMFMLFRLFTS